MATPPPFTPDQLLTPEVAADPYPAYRDLRERSPVRYVSIAAGALPNVSAPIRAWGFLKATDVYGALQDHATFSSQSSMGPVSGPRLVLLQDDPPRHTRLRRLVNNAFTLRRTQVLEPWISEVADELLDGTGQDECDLVQTYTVPLPVRVIARLLGIPGRDYATFKRWTDAFLSGTGMSPAERAQQLHDMVAYFGRMAALRRARRADDLISALVAATVEGEALEEWEILGFCTLLLIAGNETTTNLLGNLLNQLVDRPELWQRLRTDRSLVEPVIEESLRYESPVQRLFRVATRDIEVSGARISQGDRVTMFYGAANRDASAFPDPDVFRLDRDLRHHVAFGAGIHYCLGAPLARVEARVTLNAFLDRYSVLKRGRSSPLRQSANYIVYGFRRLPLVLCR